MCRQGTTSAPKVTTERGAAAGGGIGAGEIKPYVQ